ncbi:MAG: RNA 2',3'-cyclic phosphodiesterase [Candidatus Acidiferrales bacterium]
MRLFVALEVPENVRRALAELIAKLRPAAPAARWVRAENIHVTLKFIGEVPPGQLDPIRGALSAMRLDAAVSIRFRGLGFFPNDRRPRVFWAGMDASENFAPLAASIEAALAPLGIPRESRPFTPHLTLARFPEPRPAPELLEAVAPLLDKEFGSATTSEFHLMESRLKPGGAQYTRLATFSFAPLRAQGE